MTKQLILASGSPRRKELLSRLGIPFSVEAADIDETHLLNEAPQEYVERLAREKATAVSVRYADEYRQFEKNNERAEVDEFILRPEVVVIGSDTTVVCNGVILGKPNDEADALSMLRSLSGSRHTVLTAVALAMQNNIESFVVTTNVYFKVLNDEEVKAYWHTGEPRDKAGGYGIQGLGGVFVERIEGSYSSVVGLPLCETANLLEKNGFKLFHLLTEGSEQHNERRNPN